MLQTGYFVSEKALRMSKVHVFNTDTGRADCGVTLGAHSRFEWCANGIRFSYLTCETCRRREVERDAARAATLAAYMPKRRRS